ncbi:DUF6302 family protein [Streptomyces sp. NPDC051214]|uniref:DUF6302 family protein n=1 Tax=Streptomyces sp. NPDC051214 TaxID=3155282 RepID=UPI003413FF8B
MSAAATAPKPTASSLPQWQPPLTGGEPRIVLEQITSCEPLNIEAISDDLYAAIGSQAPPATETVALVRRLRQHLKQLSNIAIADPAYPHIQEMGLLIKLGRTMRGEPWPTRPYPATGIRGLTPRRRADRGPLHQGSRVMHALAHPPATVTLMPPQEAYDHDLYANRLAKPRLLEESVAVRSLRMPFLAVPLGGTRQGGYLSVACPCVGQKACDALRDRPGSPDLYLRPTPYPDTADVVEWGEGSPARWRDCDDITLGRFYGYSERVITAFTNRRAHAQHVLKTPTSAPNHRSPAAP